MVTRWSVKFARVSSPRKLTKTSYVQGGVGKDEEAMVAFKLKNEPVQNEREPMRSVIVGQPMYINIIETLEEKFRRGQQ